MNKMNKQYFMDYYLYDSMLFFSCVLFIVKFKLGVCTLNIVT